jgi:hypothetical protein
LQAEHSFAASAEDVDVRRIVIIGIDDKAHPESAKNDTHEITHPAGF